MARQGQNSKFKEIGVSGVPIFGGVPYAEYQRELQGHQGRRTYREMADNDATAAAMLTAMDYLIRSVSFEPTPAEDTPDAQEAADWLDTVFKDMDQSFDDTLTEINTFLTYGWSVQEIVYKRRSGEANNPYLSSQHEDGTIGIKKLAPRDQHSLDRWELGDNGEILGMWQWPPTGGEPVLIPFERMLHFRTSSASGSPEGRSILRSAYRNFYYVKHIQNIEAIAIEREMAGMPVARIPSEYFDSTDPAKTKVLEKYKKIVRDLKFNEQGGLVLPSDVWKDVEGESVRHTNQKMVEFELVSAAGTRSIDTGSVIRRHQQDMARTILADFLLLGSQERGSYALSQSKSDLFLESLKAFVGIVAETINRHLIPRLWEINGFNSDLMPTLEPGRVAPIDLEELGKFVSDLAGAGIILADEETERHLRSAANLPQQEGM